MEEVSSAFLSKKLLHLSSLCALYCTVGPNNVIVVIPEELQYSLMQISRLAFTSPNPLSSPPLSNLKCDIKLLG